jgi:hypothetical protein
MANTDCCGDGCCTPSTETTTTDLIGTPVDANGMPVFPVLSDDYLQSIIDSIEAESVAAPESIDPSDALNGARQ